MNDHPSEPSGFRPRPGDELRVLRWLWSTRAQKRPMAPTNRRRPTLSDLAGVNFDPHDANEAIESLRAVTEHFLSMRPRHPLGYFPDVYGREMTKRARAESLREAGHGGYFRGCERENFVFIGKFAGLYLKDLRAWLEANEGHQVRTEFAAWHLSFEYCQFNYEQGTSIPLVEAATGFIPHIINDLGKAFAMMRSDFRAAGIPIDMTALRNSHWNVSYLLNDASRSTLDRYATTYHCPLARLMFTMGVEKSFPRIILWALMGLRVKAWYDFLTLDAGCQATCDAKMRELDRKSEIITKLMLVVFGDYDPKRWAMILRGATLAQALLDRFASTTDLGARYGMPAPETAVNECDGAWWAPPA